MSIFLVTTIDLINFLTKNHHRQTQVNTTEQSAHYARHRYNRASPRGVRSQRYEYCGVQPKARTEQKFSQRPVERKDQRSPGGGTSSCRTTRHQRRRYRTVTALANREQ